MNPSLSTVPTTARLAPKKVALAAGIAGAMLFGMIVMGLVQRQQVAQQPQAPALPPLYEVQGESDMLQQLHLKKDWAGVDRTPPPFPVIVPPPPVPPPPVPLFAAQGPATRLPPPEAPPPPDQGIPPWRPPAQGRAVQAPVVAPAVAPPLSTGQAPVVKQTDTEKKEEDWLFADLRPAQKKRQGDGSGGSSSPGSAGRQASTLFPQARWEQPADPTKVIYSSQILNCVLAQAIRTGQDGTIRCTVTETLYDKFGQLTPLVPQHSIIMGKVSGANVKAGQETVPITLTKVELPNGTDLPLEGLMGSSDGSSGVPGKVDNRIPQVILTAVLSAVTSIGTRGITGSTSGYNPNLGQEFTADVAQDLSRSGRRMVERTLTLDPIITVPAQSPVTIQLDHNISLQMPARVVYR